MNLVVVFFLFSIYIYTGSALTGVCPTFRLTAGQPPYDLLMKVPTVQPWSAWGLRGACPTTCAGLWDGLPTVNSWPGFRLRDPMNGTFGDGRCRLGLPGFLTGDLPLLRVPRTLPRTVIGSTCLAFRKMPDPIGWRLPWG